MSRVSGLLVSPVNDRLFGSSENSEVDYVEKDPEGRYIRYPEILGKGAFKTVYKAFDQVDGIEVAWNQVRVEDVLRTSKDLDKLYSEVGILESLKHENIIKLYHAWVDDKEKNVNMITELFTSGSLRQYRKKHKNVDMKAIKNWAKQILHGLVYLHGQNPPIIHRDLKCDNIFVNGNHGQVKIGDLGLATVMDQPTARSIIGTPEFMAPELYEEEYNELVDIYSFGLCILEMVTCEYPYSECKNAAQIYKKVTSGIKPASINLVNDPQIKEFIEKCLLPSSERLPAKELLKDPFLQQQGDQNELIIVCDPLRVPYQVPKLDKLVKSGPLSMEIDSDYKQVSSNEINGSPHGVALEYQKINKNNEFRLRGEKISDDIVKVTLRIASSTAKVRTMDFCFYLESDTGRSVATEMVEQNQITDHDVTDISEFIDYLIMKIVPNWKPSSDDHSSSETRTPHGVYPILEDDPWASALTKDDPWASALTNDSANLVSDANPPQENEDSLDDNYYYSPSFASMQDQTEPARWKDLSGYETELDFNCPDLNCVGLNEVFSNVVSLTSSYSSLSMAEDPDFVEFKMEIDTIESYYQNLIEELNKRKEDAMETIKRRWMDKKNKTEFGT